MCSWRKSKACGFHSTTHWLFDFIYQVFIFLGLNYLGSGKERPITCTAYFTELLQSLNKIINVFYYYYWFDGVYKSALWYAKPSTYLPGLEFACFSKRAEWNDKNRLRKKGRASCCHWPYPRERRHQAKCDSVQQTGCVAHLWAQRLCLTLPFCQCRERL